MTRTKTVTRGAEQPRRANWRHTLWINVRWGVGWGIGLAVFFSLYALVILVLRGSEPFTRVHVTPLGTIAAYLAGGVMAGAIVGVFRRVARHPVGAMLVGIPASFPVLVALWIATDGLPSHWNHSDRFGVIFCSLVSGPVFGFAAWYHPKWGTRT